MRVGNPGADGESKSGSFFRVGSRIIGTKETVEDLFVCLRRNADSVVAHGKACRVAFHPEIKFHYALREGVLQDIVDEVENETLQPAVVAADGSRMTRTHDALDHTSLAQAAGLSLNLSHHRLQTHWLAHGFYLPHIRPC